MKELSFDRFFEDAGELNSNFMKRMWKIMEEMDKAAKNGEVEGGWKVNRIDRPGVKGYIIRGRFGADQPSGPVDPFDPSRPWNPEKRRPVPKRRFEILGTPGDKIVNR